MECRFVIGQKVVCVDVELRRFTPTHLLNHNWQVFLGLSLNKIYTIDRFHQHSVTNDICVILKEINRFNEEGYHPKRFKPLDEIRKEKFKQMINNIPSSFYNEVVKENELV